jgi:hypothetical protein
MRVVLSVVLKYQSPAVTALPFKSSVGLAVAVPKKNPSMASCAATAVSLADSAAVCAVSAAV